MLLRTNARFIFAPYVLVSKNINTLLQWINIIVFSFRYSLILPNGFNSVTTGYTQSRWFHIVFNVIGPNDGQGYRIYHDGQLVKNVTQIFKTRSSSMDRRIVIGRSSTNSDDNYSSVQMDDLCFFNRALTKAEITMMNNWWYKISFRYY